MGNVEWHEERCHRHTQTQMTSIALAVRVIQHTYLSHPIGRFVVYVRNMRVHSIAPNIKYETVFKLCVWIYWRCVISASHLFLLSIITMKYTHIYSVGCGRQSRVWFKIELIVVRVPVLWLWIPFNALTKLTWWGRGIVAR